MTVKTRVAILRSLGSLMGFLAVVEGLVAHEWASVPGLAGLALSGFALGEVLELGDRIDNKKS
jgi:hypothetical protein